MTLGSTKLADLKAAFKERDMKLSEHYKYALFCGMGEVKIEYMLGRNDVVYMDFICEGKTEWKTSVSVEEITQSTLYDLLQDTVDIVGRRYEKFMGIVDSPMNGEFAEQYSVNLKNNDIPTDQKFHVPFRFGKHAGSASIYMLGQHLMIATHGAFASGSGFHSHAGVNSNVDNQSIKEVLQVFVTRDFDVMANVPVIKSDGVSMKEAIIDGVATSLLSVSISRFAGEAVISAMKDMGFEFSANAGDFRKGTEKPYCSISSTGTTVAKLKEKLAPLMAKKSLFDCHDTLAMLLREMNNCPKKKDMPVNVQLSLFG